MRNKKTTEDQTTTVDFQIKARTNGIKTPISPGSYSIGGTKVEFNKPNYYIPKPKPERANPQPHAISCIIEDTKSSKHQALLSGLILNLQANHLNPHSLTFLENYLEENQSITIDQNVRTDIQSTDFYEYLNSLDANSLASVAIIYISQHHQDIKNYDSIDLKTYPNTKVLLELAISE
jgi:hypothetical protein